MNGIHFIHAECHFMWWLQHSGRVYGVNFEFDSLLSCFNMTHSIILPWQIHSHNSNAPNDALTLDDVWERNGKIRVYCTFLTYTVTKLATIQIFHRFIAFVVQKFMSTLLERTSSDLKNHFCETNEAIRWIERSLP